MAKKKRDPQPDTEQARLFLEAMYPDDVPDGKFLLLWQKYRKVSRWFTDVGSMVEQIEQAPENVYMGCSLSSRNWGQHKRGAADQTAGIPAVWVEVDWQDSVHAKQMLPPTPEDAMSLIEEMPLKPSIVVMSGHGYHAWWLLHEPWLYGSQEEREHAARLVYGWHLTFRNIAMRRGWAVDSVFDLARVLRIPGTVNANDPDEKVLCKIVEFEPDRRYMPEDIEEFAVDSPPPHVEDMVDVEFKIDPNAQPPVEKLDAMLTNDDKFRQTWNRTRRDAATWSPSEYDLSLATLCALSGWSDQEIVDMLIFSRKKHGDPPKLRADYLRRTIRKARTDIDQDEAMERIEDMAFSEPEKMATEPRRKEALEKLSTIFGFKVDRITKEIAEEPTFGIQTELGEIEIGRIDKIMSQTQFRNRIAAATGKVIAKKKSGWDKIAQVILNACEEVSIGEEATRSGAALAWLRGYCEENRPGDNRDEAINAKKPFLDEGKLHLFLAPLRAWIRTSPEAGDNVSSKQLGQHLRAVGGEPIVIAHEGSTRNVWILPADVTDQVASKFRTKRSGGRDKGKDEQRAH